MPADERDVAHAVSGLSFDGGGHGASV